MSSFSLNVDKCKVLSYYRNKSPVLSNYYINNISIIRVSEFKDLGVIFNFGLNFSSHIDMVTSKACRMLGFIRRNCNEFRDPYTLKSLYTSLVRSNLEFASIVWMPSYNIYIKRLESIQKKFIKFYFRKFNFTND